MVSAAVHIDCAAEERSILALRRCSHRAPLKVVWGRLRGGAGTCGSRRAWWRGRCRLGLTANRPTQCKSTENNQRSPLEVCRTHGTLLSDRSRESTLQEALGKRGHRRRNEFRVHV